MPDGFISRLTAAARGPCHLSRFDRVCAGADDRHDCRRPGSLPGRHNHKQGGVAILVLARKYGERILIGDDIVVTAVEVRSGVVRVGIDAPKEMAIVRTELLPPGHKYYGPSPAPGAKK